MPHLELIPQKFADGIWHGLLRGDGSVPPDVAVTHLDRAVPDVSLTADPEGGGWVLSFPVPPQALSEGVQTILIRDAAGAPLGRFAMVFGEPLEGDLRAEIDLLRVELDLLQRAFRRHCAETAGDGT